MALEDDQAASGVPSTWLTAGRDRRGGQLYPVGDSPDLRRIRALPRRPPPDLDGPVGKSYVQLAKARFGRAPRLCKCQREYGRRFCILEAFPIQGWALHETALVDGLVAPVSVGGGKTFISILAALSLSNCQQAVLFIPPAQRDQLRGDYLAIREHWDVPAITMGDWGQMSEGRPTLHVVPYSKFSQEESTTLLSRLYRPDAIIADEADALRNPETARTRRAMRYWAECPSTRLVAMSGTLLAKALTDVLHIFAYALRENSPLPLDRAVGDEWGTALDPTNAWPAPPGKLGEVFGLPVRSGVRRRIVETLGVVSSAAPSTTVPLRVLERRPPPIPQVVQDALEKLRSDRERPDTQILNEDMEVARCAQELSCGFYYKWKYPRGEPIELITAWFAARKAYNSELRDKLREGREHLDSPALCERAAIRWHAGVTEVDERGRKLPSWHSLHWPAWRDIMDKVEPKDHAVWLDDWLARDAAAWAREHTGIVWVAHGAFGRRVAEVSGLPYYAGGPLGGGLIDGNGNVLEKGNRSIILSMKAHGRGRNGLQFVFSEQLVANPPASGQTWEQLFGRLSRPGQKASEVLAWYYGHTPELQKSMDSAVEKAKFIEELLHGRQALARAFDSGG